MSEHNGESKLINQTHYRKIISILIVFEKRRGDIMILISYKTFLDHDPLIKEYLFPLCQRPGRKFEIACKIILIKQI